MIKEVNALSKLNHSGIVGYGTVWYETPPSGWQEQQDQLLGISSTSSSQSCSNPALADSQHSNNGSRYKSGRAGTNTGITEGSTADTEGSVANEGFGCDAATQSKDSLDIVFEGQDAGPTPSQPELYLYIQMELCQKESLEQWIENTLKWDRRTVMDYFRQIVSAVHHVHQSGLIHRDLKVSCA